MSGNEGEGAKMKTKNREIGIKGEILQQKESGSQK